VVWGWSEIYPQRRTGEIRVHEHSLTDRLIEGLSKIPGVTLYIADNSSKQAPVISFNIKGFTPGDVGTILDQTFDIKVRTGLHCAPIMHKTMALSRWELSV